MTVTAAIGLLWTGRSLYRALKRRYYQYPPGLSAWQELPVYGAFFYFITFPRNFLFNIGVLGPIAMTQIGSINTVYVNEPDLLRELFRKKELSLRPPVAHRVAEPSFLWLSGDAWKERRKNAMQSVMTLAASGFIFKKVRETIEQGLGTHLKRLTEEQELWFPSDSTYLFSFNNVLSAYTYPLQTTRRVYYSVFVDKRCSPPCSAQTSISRIQSSQSLHV